MNRELTCKRLDAKAKATAHCAASMRATSARLLWGVEGVEDIEAYRSEVKSICTDLAKDAANAAERAKAFRELYCD